MEEWKEVNVQIRFEMNKKLLGVGLAGLSP